MLGKKLLMKGVVKRWDRLSRKLMESIHLELVKTRVDVTFRDMVLWWIWPCWIVLDDLKGVF